MLPAGSSSSGSSWTKTTVTSMVTRNAVIRMPTVSQIWPASTSGPMKMTRKTGKGSITALTPEARPCWFSGNGSGIRPCSAPCATLDKNCISTLPASSTT